LNGDLGIAEVQRPANDLERQQGSGQSMLNTERDGAAFDHGGAFQGDVENRRTLYPPAMPVYAGSDMQPGILGQDRFAASWFSVGHRDLAGGKQVMYQPALVASRAEICVIGAAQDLPRRAAAVRLAFAPCLPRAYPFQYVVNVVGHESNLLSLSNKASVISG